MTEAEKIDAVIAADAAQKSPWIGNGELQEHARDLARKLDAVREFVDGFVHGEDRADLLAILDADQ